MTNNLANKITWEMISKKGKKFETQNLDFSSPEIQEMTKNVREKQKKLEELKYKEFENLEIYIPPSYLRQGR